MENKIIEKIKEPIENKGYTLSDVIYKKEDGNNLLMIIIDKEEGITVA